MKRAFDLVACTAGLVLMLPVLISIGLIVVLAQDGPVVFSQLRPGLQGQPFRIYKFRTMRDARDRDGRLLPDGERLTRLGQFMRSLSLDELPELWNVLRGDMSLVGPRPLLMEYLDRYTPEQARRHEVRPGITGWAQVNGRNALSWEEKFKQDVWYVDNRTFWLDLKILARTAWQVLARKGINADGYATMPPFEGSKGR